MHFQAAQMQPAQICEDVNMDAVEDDEESVSVSNEASAGDFHT
jgi:hypothetical protein